jgi:hypothetical protein
VSAAGVNFADTHHGGTAQQTGREAMRISGFTVDTRS